MVQGRVWQQNLVEWAATAPEEAADVVDFLLALASFADESPFSISGEQVLRLSERLGFDPVRVKELGAEAVELGMLESFVSVADEDPFRAVVGLPK